MGTSMASVSFRCKEEKRWNKSQILDMIHGVEGLTSNLDDNSMYYAIVSPYGDMGMFLSELPEKISVLTEDYVVMCGCFDSDFAVLELVKNGQSIEECAIGAVYEEYEEFCCTNKPNVDLWCQLLIHPEDREELVNALLGEEVFVEDQLRAISRLTGFPVFMDELVYDGEF